VTDFICFKCKSKIKTKRWGKSKIEVKCACPHEFDYIRTDDDDDAIEKFLIQFDLYDPNNSPEKQKKTPAMHGKPWTPELEEKLKRQWLEYSKNDTKKSEIIIRLAKDFERTETSIFLKLYNLKLLDGCDDDAIQEFLIQFDLHDPKNQSEKPKTISEHQLPSEYVVGKPDSSPPIMANESQKEKIEKNEMSEKISITGPIVESKDDWNDDYQDEYGFNSRNSQRLNQYAVISDRFCSTCEKNGIAHLVPDTNICDVCGASPPIILGPLACGRYWSPNQNNGSNYTNSLLSKYILDNKHENPAASNFLSNLMFDFINNHHKFFDKLDFDLIIPVPNFKSDLQHVAAVSVSLKLSKLLNISCNTDILIKTQSTAGRKHHKTAEQRRNMAYSSYDICTDTPIKNQTILLIDDVLVGGSTVRKCAELLLENGANTILIMCLGDYSSYD
jgi:predicted amidophosphoribosyltransferase